MRILFISKGFRTLAVEYLSAVLKANGHQALAVNNPAYFSGSPSSVIRNIKRVDPDLIAMSVDSMNSSWYFRVARKVKTSSRLPIVMGGVHPTINAEAVIRHDCVDYVVVGEGEYALLDLADSLANGQGAERIPNVWSKNESGIIKNRVRPLIRDLDALPWPDKDVYCGRYYSDDQLPSPQHTYYITTSRGCPYKCSYCHHEYMHTLYSPSTGRVRYRSIANVISELKAVVDKCKVSSIAFWDDNFTLDRQRLVEFIEVYRQEIGLPFYCPTHPSLVGDDVAASLSKVKGARVALGLQSINPKIRKSILHRNDTNKDIKTSVRLLEHQGVNFTVDILVGLPGESAHDYTNLPHVFDSTDALKALRFFTLIYYEGMTITKIAMEQGLLDERQMVRLRRHGFAMARPAGVINRIRNFYLISFAFTPKLMEWILTAGFYRCFIGPQGIYEFIRRSLFIPQPYYVEADLRGAAGRLVNALRKQAAIIRMAGARTRMRLGRTRLYALLRPLGKPCQRQRMG